MAKRRLIDEYRFPGFVPRAAVTVAPDDPDGRIVTLERREKKRSAARVAAAREASTIASSDGYATCRAAMRESTCSSKYAGSPVGAARR